MNKIIFETIIKVTITGSLFFLETFFLSIFTQKKFSAKWHFIVSKICMMLFLVPISIIIGDGIIAKNEVISCYSSNIISNAYNSLKLDKFEYIYVMIWLIGFVMYVTVNIVDYFKFKNALKRFDSYDSKLDDILKKHNLKAKDKIIIRRNPNVKSPMLMGIINPVIRIPDYINDYQELDFIINHELIHYKRKDLFVKLIDLFITSINWFNPLVYIANKNMNRWCEISCDELLVKSKKLKERRLYGNLLLKVIENVDLKKDNEVAALCLCNESKYVKNRLYMILNFNKVSMTKKAISIMILIITIIKIAGISAFATTNVTYQMKSYIDNKVDDNTEGNGVEASENDMDNNENHERGFSLEEFDGERNQ